MEQKILFYKRLYSADAIREAIREFEGYLEATVANRGKHLEVVVRLDEEGQRAGEVLGEFLNYALGASISRRNL